MIGGDHVLRPGAMEAAEAEVVEHQFVAHQSGTDVAERAGGVKS